VDIQVNEPQTDEMLRSRPNDGVIVLSLSARTKIPSTKNGFFVRYFSFKKTYVAKAMCAFLKKN